MPALHKEALQALDFSKMLAATRMRQTGPADHKLLPKSPLLTIKGVAKRCEFVDFVT